MCLFKGFNLPERIFIYDEHTRGLDFREIKKFIENNFGNIDIIVKKSEGLVKRKGLLFDYPGTHKNFYKIAAKEKINLRCCHIIVTKDLIATFDDYKRMHIRAAVFNFPSVISLAGIVEGPAKPKEFYLYRQRYEKLGIWAVKEQEVKNKFEGEFIDYGDKRINEVLKGYIAQSIFFHITQDPFCAKKECRLFNSHWQKDLIYSQIKSAKFCRLHKKILSKIRNDRR